MAPKPPDTTSQLPPIEWAGPAIGLLDLDAFFASVEFLDHPEWRGKPLIVGGSPEMRGVVSTASYEARAYGVHSAMPSALAKQLCPQAIWCAGNHQRYREVSRQVMDIIANETPLVEQVSIDEAFFDITPGRWSRESPVDICRRIQDSVAKIGVTCSIGLGINKTVAKIASEIDKPRGLTIVWPGSETEFLSPLPVGKMSGIGSVTAEKLDGIGIHTLGQLASAEPKVIRERFGSIGPRMIERAAGLERSEVMSVDAAEDAKSVSNERTFAHDLTTLEELNSAIGYVSEMLGQRLRAKALLGSTVTLKLKFSATQTRTARTQLPYPTDEPAEFGPAARELLGEIWCEGMPVRLVGVGMSNFQGDAATTHQMSLFGQSDDAPTLSEDRRRLSHATDEVRERFGNKVLAYGRDWRFRDTSGDTTSED